MCNSSCDYFVLQLLQRRDALHKKAQYRRNQLEESYKFQMFERDCDETKIWINEKLKAASDEGYLVGVGAVMPQHTSFW